MAFSVTNQRYVIFVSTLLKKIQLSTKILNISTINRNDSTLLVRSINFHGLIFDDQLNWGPHLPYPENKCSKKSSLLKFIENHKWGRALKETLFTFYRTTIKSKIDYGSIIYTTSKASILKMIDPMQNQGVKISTGAFRSRSVNT